MGVVWEGWGAGGAGSPEPGAGASVGGFRGSRFFPGLQRGKGDFPSVTPTQGCGA